jgi:hypothetical protein
VSYELAADGGQLPRSTSFAVMLHNICRCGELQFISAALLLMMMLLLQRFNLAVSFSTEHIIYSYIADAGIMTLK